MNQIIEFFDNITKIQIMDIVIAIAIIMFFKIFSAGFSYIIVKMFKFKTKNRKIIKESAFYKPLKIFFTVLGVYVAIVFLKDSFKITEKVMQIVTKAFEIITVMVFAKGLAESLTPKSSLVKKMKQKMAKPEDDSMFEFILKILRVLIYIIAVFIVITLLGVNLSGLVAGLGIGGVIVTLAAQDTAKNLFGGLVIFIDKPFIVGDWIQMDSFEGTVEDITFRSTRVRTFENSLVNIPNSIISNASIINWSKMEKRRYKTNLCVEKNTSLDRLENFKTKVAQMLQQREGIYDESIIVKFDEIRDDGINILISSYTASVDYVSYLGEKEDINYKIMKILKEEGINLVERTQKVYAKIDN